MYVVADKYLTDNDPVTQGFITCIFTNLIPGMDYRLVYDTKFWIRLLGGEFNRCSADKYLGIAFVDFLLPASVKVGYHATQQGEDDKPVDVTQQQKDKVFDMERDGLVVVEKRYTGLRIVGVVVHMYLIFNITF